MSVWERLIQLTSASPFTGTWMSVATSVLALVVLTVARRMLPPENRHHGRALLAFLGIGLGLALLRLVLVAVGAGSSIVGQVLGMATTFCVAMGAVGAVVMLALEVLPARAGFGFPYIIRDLFHAAAFILIVFGVLAQSGVNVMSMVTTAGVMTAIIGLALQSTLANLFAGLMLNMDRSLEVGDWVQVGTRTGEIAQIRWRSTLLRNADGDLLIVPNTQLISNEVYNFSRPQRRHRVWVKIGFHYRHPPNEVRKVIAAAAREAPGVLDHPAPDSFPEQFGDSAVIYNLRFWIDDVARLQDIQGEVLSRVWYAAQRAGIEIPFPIRTVHLHNAGGAEARSAADSDKADCAALLDRVELFRSLEQKEREALADSMRRVAFARDEAIIRQGEPGDSAYLITDGDVRVWLQQGDVTQEVATLHAGELFGEMSLMTGDPRTATCTAASDVTCYVLDRAGFQRVLTLRPAIADEMSAKLAARQAVLAQKGGELEAKAASMPREQTQLNLLNRMRRFFDLK